MLLSTLALLLAPEAHAELRASALKIDITPKTPQWLMGYGARQSTRVNDPLFHRIAALDDGQTQVFLISSDFCVFSPSVYDDFAAELKRQTGIDRKQVWWMTTHTHSAPEVGPPGIYDILLKGRSEHPWNREYLEFVVSSLIDGVKRARTSLEPARISIGTGISRANINRRARDLDGTISLGLNPDGPTDRQLGVLRIERPDGGVIGMIANYAMHATVLGGQFVEVSGDAPGIVASYVESRINAPLIYMNGAAGNLAPIYTTQSNTRTGHLGEFRVLIGDRILEVHRSLTPGADAKLWLGEKWIETPRKDGLGWPAELPLYASRVQGRDFVRIPVRLLRIADTVIWAAPVELFCEIAMRVRAESPFRHTFYFGYANGWLGYLPTAAAFTEGGYEPRTSPFTAQAEQHFGDGVVAAIAAIPRN